MKKTRFKLLLTTIFLFWAVSGVSQKVISLYGGMIPNSKQVPDKEEKIPNTEVDTILTHVSVPTLSVFLPPEEKASGTAVIICPGGGYHALLIKREGCKIAKALNRIGITAFVLKYRLPDDRTMWDKSIGPLQDAQEAIKIVRKRAAEWNIDQRKIGIMGFSAGGHLAAMAGTHFNSPVIENKKKISLRPDFMILIYPVISFTDSIGHRGSRDFLLGTAPTEEQIRYYSNEFQVSNSTPPAFLTHAGDDTVVPVENSIEFYKALKQNDVPCELHVYSKGEHGYLKSPPFDEWFGSCVNWMKDKELIK